MAPLCILEKGLSLSGQIRKMHPHWGDAASHDFTPNSSFGQGLCEVHRMYRCTWQSLFTSTTSLLRISSTFYMHGLV